MIHLVLTSAVNTPYGVFSAEQREQHLADNCRHLRSRFPDANIIVAECSPTRLDEAQESRINQLADQLHIYSNEPHLQDCYSRWRHEAIHKNLGETWCLAQVLDSISPGDGDIVAKMSGRYRIQDDFRWQYKKGKITLGHGPSPTGNPIAMSDIRFWYPSRLFYWGAESHAFMTKAMMEMHKTLLEHVSSGRYTDIEHCLYHHIPKEIINCTLPGKIGIEGELAASGETVRD